MLRNALAGSYRWCKVRSALRSLETYGAYLWINENPDQYEDLRLGLQAAHRTLSVKAKPCDGLHSARMDLLYYVMDHYYVRDVQCIMATMPMNRFIDEVEKDRTHAHLRWGECESAGIDLIPWLWRLLYPQEHCPDEAIKHLYHHLCVYLHQLNRQGPFFCAPDKRLLSIVFSILSFHGILKPNRRQGK